MKKFFCKFFCYTLLLIIIVCIIIKKSPLSPDSYEAAFLDKELLLEKSMNENRLILVGGSSLAFGIDSKYLQDSLKIHVINLGLHAGLGLKFMIDDVSRFVKPGDILVIVPEYDHFFGSAYGSNALAVVCNFSPKSSGLLNLKQWEGVIINTPKNIRLNAWKSLIVHNSQSVYSRSSFNSFGDIVRHQYLKRDKVISPEIFSHNKIDLAMLTYFSKFVQKERSNGVKVLVLPPVFMQTSYTLNANKIGVLDSLLTINKCGFEAAPLRYALNDSLFFNSAYHTTWEGRRQRTDSILNDIKRLLVTRNNEN